MLQMDKSMGYFTEPTQEQLARMAEQIEMDEPQCDGDCFTCQWDCALKTEEVLFYAV